MMDDSDEITEKDRPRSGEGSDFHGSDVWFHEELLGDDVLPPALREMIRRIVNIPDEPDAPGEE
jgi:hypothetical protein